jgi:hypothetical protein
MQSVNFRCGHCNNLMEVDEDLLGQQVPCPHCQQIVVLTLPTPAAEPASVPLAPPVAPPLAAESTGFAFQAVAGAPPGPEPPRPPSSGNIAFNLPKATEEDSIFEPVEAGSDSLFDIEVRPTVELPPDAVFLPPGAPPVRQITAAEPPPPPEAPALVVATGPAIAPDEPAPVALATPEPVLPPPDITPAVPDLGTVQESAVAETAPLLPVGPRAVHTDKGSWFLALVFIPLCTYAVLATVLIIVLYTRLQDAYRRSPLEELHDLEGEFKGASHQKRGAITYDRAPPETPLPAYLTTHLGQPLRVGDLEVTPEKVELRRLRVRVDTFNAELEKEPSLVLYLHLRNLARDVVFCPTDPFFERRWKEGQSRALRPYTYLEIGGRKFYGGPFAWRPGQRRRESIEGQRHQPLQPGEAVDTLICTDSDDRVAQVLAASRGPLLWRVQLRRGLVAVRNREVSATAVVGVAFTAEDVVSSQQ